jgi:biopolymer transport protein ExbD
MSMAIGNANCMKAEINMTPMIDVLLVLIIIFMVITPLAPLGLETRVPQNAAYRPVVEPAQDLVITAVADGSYVLNREPLAQTELQARLTDLFRHGAANAVFVRGGRDVEFRRIAETVDLARGAGVSRIGLMP